MMRFMTAIQEHFSSFFLHPSHPVNLTIFRIILFLVLIRYVPQNLIVASGLPADLRYPPPGYESFFSAIPINPSVAHFMLELFLCFCVLGLIGFCTRTSAAGALLSGLYVYGVPEFFGKIDHYHHLMWFLAILAVSRSGDMLSADWFVFYKRRTPQASAVYGLPIRLIWIMIGLIYFFPGYWKWKISGWAWALSDNLKYVMYQKWHELGGFTPPFPLDMHPLLYQSAGLLIMLFELSFLFLLFIPRIRMIAIIGGILFHIAIEAFMGIGFWELRWCYVIFFDWYAIAVYIKRRLRPATVLTRQPAAQKKEPFRLSLLPVLLTGAFIIAECIICGVFYIDSWPFGVYPSFAAMAPSTVISVQVSVRQGVTTATLTPDQFVKLLGDQSRWTAMEGRMLYADPDSLPSLCRDMASSIIKNLPEFKNATLITFTKVVQSVDPHKKNDPPLSQTVLCSVKTT